MWHQAVRSKRCDITDLVHHAHEAVGANDHNALVLIKLLALVLALALAKHSTANTPATNMAWKVSVTLVNQHAENAQEIVNSCTSSRSLTARLPPPQHVAAFQLQQTICSRAAWAHVVKGGYSTQLVTDPVGCCQSGTNVQVILPRLIPGSGYVRPGVGLTWLHSKGHF